MKRFHEFEKHCLILLVVALFFFAVGYSTSSNGQPSNQFREYPISSDVQTTRQRTIVMSTTFSGTIIPQNLSHIPQYDQFGYGKWSYGPGIDAGKRTDIMQAGYSGTSVTRREKLLNFFTISDIHITDKEAPNQLIYLQQFNASNANQTSIYSGTMLYTTFVLDAAIQTINALHKKDPFDFGISLGDTCNSTSYNELRWYIDVIDGKVIIPSSGAHLGADTIDYQKPYKAAGIDKTIPWYQAIGNHDHFYIGSIPVQAYNLGPTYVSDTVKAIGNILAPPLDVGNINKNDYYGGVIDGSTPNGNIIAAGPVGDFSSPPKVAADPDRRSLTKPEWIGEFLKTTSNPFGHGFSSNNANNDFACYSFLPKSNIPIKVIVLDDTQTENDQSSDIHGHGFLTQDRWNWLKKELADGDAAGQLMIIAAHVPIGVQPHYSELEWWINPSPSATSPQNAVDILGLVKELEKHPNLLMWIAGHRHLNTVKAFVSTDPAHPENGFWQVETCSLRDFPQQFRTFEIYVNSDDTISIVTTNVDPAIQPGTPAATSRKYAVASQQIVGNNLNPNFPNSDPTLPPNTQDPTIKPMLPTVYSYNAELMKQLSPEMKAKLRNLRQ
jgi:metallophosphoesterase (TIGR03768 family)